MIRLLLFFIFLFFISLNLNSKEIKLEKIIDDLNKPWSLSFIDQESVLITEKPGKLYKLNLKDKKITEVNHNLSVLEHGLGGLLDVLY